MDLATNLENKKTLLSRNSNLELFRIIVMLLIIAHHYVVNSGLTTIMYANPLESKSIFLFLFGAWGKIGINCFVLITGYFMCKSHITAKKFFTLLFEILFYKIIIGAIFIATGYQELSFKSVLKIILPITSLETNFIGCFLVFYLTIPFLSILVNHLDEKMHLRLLLLIFIFFVFFSTVPWFSVGYSYVSWFICLFFIASYFRLHPKRIFSSTKIWSFASLGTLLLSAASVVVLTFIYAKYEKGGPYFLVADSFKLLAVLTSVSWFLFFKNINIKQSRFINLLGGATFGVLLIHANSDAMRQWLWVDLLKNTEMYNNGNWIYLHSIGCVLAIFVVCAVIDILRKYLLEKPFISWWDKLWNKVTYWFIQKENKLFHETDNDSNIE